MPDFIKSFHVNHMRQKDYYCLRVTDEDIERQSNLPLALQFFFFYPIVVFSAGLQRYTPPALASWMPPWLV